MQPVEPAEPVDRRVATEFCYHAVCSELAPKNVGNHVPDGDAAESETVGLLRQCIFASPGVKVGFEILRQVEPRTGYITTSCQHVGRRPRGRDVRIVWRQACSNVTHLGLDVWPPAAEHLLMRPDVTAESVVDVQRAAMPCLLKCIDEPKQGGVAA
jgi:hypothetical protein